MVNLIIKGAIYQMDDVLLRPHYTGNFNVVDCTEYKTKKQIKEEYSKEIAKSFIKDGYYLTCDGVKYYQAEYSAYGTDRMELLSDLSSLEFFDEDTEF